MSEYISKGAMASYLEDHCTYNPKSSIEALIISYAEHNWLDFTTNKLLSITYFNVFDRHDAEFRFVYTDHILTLRFEGGDPFNYKLVALAEAAGGELKAALSTNKEGQ